MLDIFNKLLCWLLVIAKMGTDNDVNVKNVLRLKSEKIRKLEKE